MVGGIGAVMVVGVCVVEPGCSSDPLTYSMLVTAEVSKFSGWLNAEAPENIHLEGGWEKAGQRSQQEGRRVSERRTKRRTEPNVCAHTTHVRMRA